MNESDRLKSERERIKISIGKIKVAAEHLSNSINGLNRITSNLKNSYKVDDVGGGSTYIGDLIEKEQGIYSKMIDEVIPELYRKVDNLDRMIADAEVKELLEGEV